MKVETKALEAAISVSINIKATMFVCRPNLHDPRHNKYRQVVVDRLYASTVGEAKDKIKLWRACNKDIADRVSFKTTAELFID